MAQFNNDYLDDVWGMLFVPNKKSHQKTHTHCVIYDRTNF